jgi:undecaprenyl-diphosphatase
MDGRRPALAVLLLALLATPAGPAHSETDAPAGPGMTLAEAVLLGVVEGVTEYLPVSSTGHLIVVERLLGIPSSHAADAFAICIQSGAILAVLVLYRRRLRSMARGLLGGDAAGRRVLAAVLAASMPAALAGVLLGARITEHLFGLWPVVVAWFVGGLAILLVSWLRRRPRAEGLLLEHVTLRMGLLVGLAQCLALWPGVSRSLVTIVGGVLVGLRLVAAVEFSFLVGLVVLGGATVYKGIEAGPAMLQAYGLTTLLAGFAAAALSAAIAVGWLVAYLARHGLALFGWYRVGVALVVASLVLAGVL